MRHRRSARTRMSFASAAVASTIVVVLASCSTAAPSPSPTPEGQETAWERALSGIGDDGLFSKDAALDLFATAFGPVPGVDVQQDLTGISDRTIALHAVQPYLDEYTPEQRAAIEAVKAPPEGSETVTIPPVGEARTTIRLAAEAPFELRQAIVDAGRSTRETIASHLGRDMLGDVNISFLPQPADTGGVSGGKLLGEAWPEYSGGVSDGCRMTIYPHALAKEPLVILNTLAHEIFHCFQFDGYRTPAAAAAMPGWVQEGQAEWVGNIVGGEDFSDARMWQQYLTQPQTSLLKRTYDAVGFYSHLAETGTDPWSVFLDMWIAGSDNLAIYRASGADNDAFEDSWASGVLREPARSSAWDTTGPGITPDAFEPPQTGLGGGDRLPVAAAQYTNDIDGISVTADLLHVAVEGHARLSDGVIDTTLLEDAWFCAKDDGCGTCPDGTQLPVPPAPLAGPVVIAASGTDDGTVGWAEGQDMDDSDLCGRKPTPRPTPPAPDPCADGCANSNGDPHLRTVDGAPYDFMAAGEFVALRSADGSIEIQVRQEPFEDLTNVTINTAVAVRSGEHRFGMYMEPAEGTTETARLDGADLDPTQPTELTGGGRVTPVGGGWQVDLPDGTIVWALGIGSYGINLVVAPSDELRANGTGILGPVPAGSMGVPALPDGTALPATGDSHAVYEGLYVRFAGAWRVTDETTLFEYPDGGSTADYQRPRFPAEEDLVGLDDLTETQRAAGEAACTGVTDPVLHAQCVYDVGITSDSGFAEGYRLVEAATLPQSGVTVRVVNVYDDFDGDEDIESIDVYGRSSDGEALLATVPGGEVSEPLEPGYVQYLDGTRETSIIVRRQGEGGVLFETTETMPPGSTVTIVVATGPADAVAPGQGRGARWSTLFEEHPEFPLRDAPPGQALVEVNTIGLIETPADQFNFASVGDGCLESPDAGPAFPAPQPFGGGAGGELVVEPGVHELTIHGDPGTGVFPDCTDESLVPPIPLPLAAGDRQLIVLYAYPGSTDMRAVSVPLVPSSGRPPPTTPAPAPTGAAATRQP